MATAPNWVCRLLRVAPSGFFRRRSKPPSDRAIRRAWLTDVIAEIYQESRPTYGWRRVRAALDDAYGQQVNKTLVQAIMRELGIAGFPPVERSTANRISSTGRPRSIS
jgi:putative transposase